MLSKRAACLLLAAGIPAACGDKKNDGSGPSTPPSASAGASASGVPIAPAGPPSPLSVVLESKGQLLLSGLEGGILVTDVAHTRVGRAPAGGELSSEPMPEGLPAGAGQIVRVAGRSPAPVWLVYERLQEDGKVLDDPLFRLGKEGLKKYADDWKPALAPWTKHRILAASTSSGKLKIKVIEPSLPAPPDNLPSVHLADASCEKTLRVETLAALPSGEVFAGGTCKPDTAAGAGASPVRYVVIRWTAAAPTRDAGALDAGVDDRPGLVDVLPGVAADLAHAVLHARSPADVWVGGAKLFHFDGASWGAVALPARVTAVRGLAATADGKVWMATEHGLFRRPAAGAAWQEVPLPGGGTWEVLEVVASAKAGAADDVWVAARRTAADGPRDVLLRARAAPAIVRWE